MIDVLHRNNVSTIGSGEKVMIFAHGFVGDQTLWRHVVEDFAADFQIVLFDYVGSGKSDLQAYDHKKYSGLKGYAQDVLDICDTLSIRDAVFVGHSISSMIGLVAGIEHPEYFSRMIFVAPSPRYLNDDKYYGGFEKAEVDTMLKRVESDLANWAKELAPAVVNQPQSPELSDELIQKLLSTDHKVVMNFAKTTFFIDYRKELLKFKIPSLTLQCREDIMAPIDVGDYLNAHLQNNTLKLLKAKGHFPQLSAPAEVVRAIKDYLR